MNFRHLILVTVILNAHLGTVYLANQRITQRPFEDMNDDTDIPLFNRDVYNWPKQLDFFANHRPCAKELQNSCQNGATCMTKLSSDDVEVEHNVAQIVCLCRLGWQGDFCEKSHPVQQQALYKIQLVSGELVPCVAGMSTHQRHCFNRGACLQRADMSQRDEPAVCLCADGWNGENCQLRNDLDSSLTLNSSVEEDEDIIKDVIKKSEDENIFDTLTDRFFDCSSSEENLCRNDAKCVRVGESIKCFCKPGWSGKNCEKQSYDSDGTSCPPNKNPCHQGSTCLLQDEQPVCHCAPNFTGERCDQPQKDNNLEEEEEFDETDLTQAMLFYSCQGQAIFSLCAPYGGICREFGMRGGARPTPMCFCYRGYVGERCERFSFYKFVDLPEPLSVQDVTK